MRTLITGAAGTIGSELVRQLAPKNTLFLIDNNETGLFDLVEEMRLKGYDTDYRLGDIRDAFLVAGLLAKFNPDVVYHAAALKHVTPNEKYPRETVETNLIGLLNVLEATTGKFVFISTDKVVNMNSIMGVSKKMGELIVKNAGGISVRFGNVLGSRGSVIPLWQASIDRGEAINVTDENMSRYFMTIEDAVKLVIEAGTKGKPGEIWIMDMGEPVNILQLAKDIIKKSGKDIGIKMIGIRPGEMMFEKLMTKDEESRAVREGNFYVI